MRKNKAYNFGEVYGLNAFTKESLKEMINKFKNPKPQDFNHLFEMHYSTKSLIKLYNWILKHRIVYLHPYDKLSSFLTHLKAHDHIQEATHYGYKSKIISYNGYFYQVAKTPYSWLYSWLKLKQKRNKKWLNT